MPMDECNGSPGPHSSDGQGSSDDRRVNQDHILRYIAELTREMARLAKEHECAELADDLAAVSEKAEQKRETSKRN